MGEAQTGERRKYAKPPIYEAVCEIYLKLPQPLGDPILEKVQTLLRPDLPLQQMVEEKTVNVEIALDTARTTEIVTGKKLIAKSLDTRNLVQLGSTMLVVNRLAPYEGWEEVFRNSIVARFNQLQSVTHIEGVTRIGLRYINKIDLPADRVNWPDWFTVSSPTPVALQGREGLFQSHAMYHWDDGIRIVVNFGTFPSERPERASVLLDVDVVWEGSSLPDSLHVMLDSVHTPHNVVFESYLKDSVRKLFVPLP